MKIIPESARSRKERDIFIKSITGVVWRSVRMDGQICGSQTKESPVPVNILMFNFISKQGHSL